MKRLLSVMFVVGAMAVGSTAQAADAFCPTGLDSGDASATQRVFGVTTTTGPAAECFSFGTGGNPNPIAAGYTLIDVEETGSEEAAGLVLTGLGTTGGTFSFNVSLWSSFSNLIIVFNSGVSERDPDWAAFDLDSLTISGLWNIYPAGTQSLTKASLYGLATGSGTGPDTGDGAAVPEPASLMLLGSGLALAAARFRRRA